MRNLALAWITAAGVTVLVTGIFFIGLYRANPGDVQQNFCMWLRDDQCEAINTSWGAAEPWNTFSNAGYFLAGMIIFLRARTAAAYAFAGNLCLLALFSGWYHARLSAFSQEMDVAFIYGVFGSVILLAMRSLADVSSAKPWDWWIALFLMACAFSVVKKDQPLQVPMGFAALATGFWLFDRSTPGGAGRPVAYFLIVGAGAAFVLEEAPLLSLALVVLAVIAFVWGRSARAPLNLTWSGPAYWWALLAVVLDLAGYSLKKPLNLDSTAVFVALASVLVIQMMDGILAHPKVRRDWTENSWWVSFRLSRPILVRVLLLLLVAGAAFALRLTDGYDNCSDMPVEPQVSCQRELNEGAVAAEVATCTGANGKCNERRCIAPKALCRPGGVQAHAGWHLLSAAALVMVYELLSFLRVLVPVSSTEGSSRDLPVFPIIWFG